MSQAIVTTGRILEIKTAQDVLLLPHGTLRISVNGEYAHNLPTQWITEQSIVLAAKEVLERLKNPVTAHATAAIYSEYPLYPLTRADVLAEAIARYGYGNPSQYGWTVRDVLRRVDQRDLTRLEQQVNRTCIILPIGVFVTSGFKPTFVVPGF